MPKIVELSSSGYVFGDKCRQILPYHRCPVDSEIAAFQTKYHPRKYDLFERHQIHPFDERGAVSNTWTCRHLHRHRDETRPHIVSPYFSLLSLVLWVGFRPKETSATSVTSVSYAIMFQVSCSKRHANRCMTGRGTKKLTIRTDLFVT